MLNEQLRCFLAGLGLTPERAALAADTAEPTLANYLRESASCRHVRLRFLQQMGRVKPKSSSKDNGRRLTWREEIDAEFAATDSTAKTLVIDASPDSAVMTFVREAGLPRPRSVLLAGDDAPRVTRHFHSLMAPALCTGAGLMTYLGDPRGGSIGDGWLRRFLTQADRERPPCDVCVGRWIDADLEHFVRYLAVGDDARAGLLTTYLRHLAPLVQCEGLTDQQDLVFTAR